MGLLIRAYGDWGGAQLADVEAVASSAAASFDGIGDLESMTLRLEPTAGDDDPPRALSRLDSSGAFVIQLNIRGNLWARLAYQFAHEFCHVLADPQTWTLDRFSWIEEVLCETASLFALRVMSNTWKVAPPYPNWQGYASELERYAVDRWRDPAHSLPLERPFASWLVNQLALLEANPSRRADNTIIAKQLLPIFESDTSGWGAVRCLHASSRLSASFVDFMNGWRNACLPMYRSTVEAIKAVLAVSDVEGDS